MVAGHPFKGAWVSSTGQLAHPDMKRFAIATAVLFKPPMPSYNPAEKIGAEVAHAKLPSFSDFFGSYFGNYTKIYFHILLIT